MKAILSSLIFIVNLLHISDTKVKEKNRRESKFEFYHLNFKIMLIAAIIIYIVFALLFGALWPFSMFGRGGCLGQIIVIAWVSLLVAGLNN